jgi:hypothetical protein
LCDFKLKISLGRKKYVGHAKKGKNIVISPSYIAVGTVAELRTGQPGNGGSISGRSKRFFSQTRRSDRL